ncbi:MAG TPA: hypothetical protein ENN75_01825 [candidate division Zixibacteria bacterium]|nr:hypothetical protein [candidate division Zixibacteria bacterium]
MQEDFWNVDWDKEFAEELQEDELALFEKLAKEVVQRQLTVPAVMLIESFKPFNWIGSQLMLMLEPITVYMFNIREMQIVRRALQKRDAMEVFVQKIEKADSEFGPKKKKKRSSDE